MEEKKPVVLNLVSLQGNKKTIQKVQDICARLTGTYQENLVYLKSVRPSAFPAAEELWTQDNIRLLGLQNYAFWKSKTRQDAIQGRAVMEFPPNIAELLLWFGVFKEMKNEPVQTS